MTHRPKMSSGPGFEQGAVTCGIGRSAQSASGSWSKSSRPGQIRSPRPEWKAPRMAGKHGEDRHEKGRNGRAAKRHSRPRPLPRRWQHCPHGRRPSSAPCVLASCCRVYKPKGQGPRPAGPKTSPTMAIRLLAIRDPARSSATQKMMVAPMAQHGERQDDHSALGAGRVDSGPDRRLKRRARVGH